MLKLHFKPCHHDDWSQCMILQQEQKKMRRNLSWTHCGYIFSFFYSFLSFLALYFAYVGWHGKKPAETHPPTHSWRLPWCHHTGIIVKTHLSIEFFIYFFWCVLWKEATQLCKWVFHLYYSIISPIMLNETFEYCLLWIWSSTWLK